MATHLERGFGSRKDVQILLVTLILGLLAMVWALHVRDKVTAPAGVSAVELSPEEVLKLAGLARGPSRIPVFKPQDLARVVTFAPGRDPDASQWRGVPAQSIITVRDVNIEGDDVWVWGWLQQPGDDPRIIVHGSFLELYTPLLLEKTVELADVKLIAVSNGGKSRRAINGWLRNVGPTPITQCVVTCTFQNERERPVHVEQTAALTLPSHELVRFHTPLTDKPFASISIQIAYATADGLRTYLPQVVIQKSNL